ncbi:hypothetical protein ACIKT0_04960 [Hansschlegelia beijingensis]|uniref:hypothetical protein n=1 Tax=Hansschlegelia beijingensis TaxID=1133344 RepID=UPI00387F1FF6
MDRAPAADLDAQTVGLTGPAVDDGWLARVRPEPVARLEPPLPRTYWSALPNRWILEGGLRAFREDLACAGRSTAALKLLAVVAIAADSERFRAPDRAFAAQITHDELYALAGLSRPLVVAAKKFLSARGLVETDQDASTGRTIYLLQGWGSTFGSIHHAGTPARESIFGIASLRKLSCRQANTLRAMKVYMLLSALRRGEVDSVVTSRAEIVDLTGLREGHVESSLAELKKRNMITMDLRSARVSADAGRFTLRTCPL